MYCLINGLKIHLYTSKIMECVYCFHEATQYISIHKKDTIGFYYDTLCFCQACYEAKIKTRHSEKIHLSKLHKKFS